MRVESTSKIRSWVVAKKHFKVGGLDEAMEIQAGSKERLDKGWRSFLDQGGWDGKGGKRPDNDKRKKDKDAPKK
jgi:hypothetical protein